MTWAQFQSACQKLRYHGDVAGAWRAFDSDLSGYLSLNEVDTEASAARVGTGGGHGWRRGHEGGDGGMVAARVWQARPVSARLT